MTLTKIPVDYILFDYDGTLVNSIPAVEQYWTFMCQQHNANHPELDKIDIESFLHDAHGTRTADLIAQYFPEAHGNPNAVEEFEMVLAEKYGHLAVQIPGSEKLLQSLHANNIHWGIVTSGTRKYILKSYLNLLKGLEKPEVLITANEVQFGKPNPEGYLKGFEGLKSNDTERGSTPKNVYVFEDAAVGIKAGIDAGFKVVGIATTFSKEKLLEAGASYVIQDMTKVKASGNFLELDCL